MSVNRNVTVPVGESAMRLESSLPSYQNTVASPSEVEGVEVARRSNRPADSLDGLGRQRLGSDVAARAEVGEDEAPTSASPTALPASAADEWPKACACFALDSRRLARHVINLRPKCTLNDPSA